MWHACVWVYGPSLPDVRCNVLVRPGLIIERIASIAVPPNDPLQQYMEEHKNDMFMQEREEIDEVFFR